MVRASAWVRLGQVLSFFWTERSISNRNFCFLVFWVNPSDMTSSLVEQPHNFCLSTSLGSIIPYCEMMNWASQWACLGLESKLGPGRAWGRQNMIALPAFRLDPIPVKNQHPPLSILGSGCLNNVLLRVNLLVRELKDEMLTLLPAQERCWWHLQFLKNYPRLFHQEGWTHLSMRYGQMSSPECQHSVGNGGQRVSGQKYRNS